MDDFFPGKRNRRIQLDLNVVPILDMLVCIIFFLLLSTSFVGYTKLTLPPSGVSTITEPLAPPPLNPKLLIAGGEKELKVVLTWEGASPGHRIKKLNYENIYQEQEKVTADLKLILEEFVADHAQQKTLQLGMASSVPYQVLINAMDSARELLPDQVLISYQEAQAMTDKINSTGN